MAENRKLSTAKKLVQAAALAAILVPLGSVMVETSTISCGFSGAGGCTSGGTTVGNKVTFDFHGLNPEFDTNYLLSLEFASIDSPFRIGVTDSQTTQAELIGGGDSFAFSPNRLIGFPGHTCNPIRDAANGCVEFIFGNGAGGPPPEPGGGWSGLYNIRLVWDAPTDEEHPGTLGRIHLLHNSGPDGAAFNEDFCARFGCTYIPGGGDGDLGSRGDGFHSVLVTTTAIPEPGSVLLVATGVAALYTRRRRRRD